MLEILALLLPVAAASGWLAANKSNRRAHESNVSKLSHGKTTKFRGLNYRLNEQPANKLVNLTQVGGEAAESQIALGNLFRRNGEVERAISIHQDLITESSLNEEQHGQALFELGMDYLRAGLFDRAEQIFAELTEDSVNGESATQQLLQIYQHEKDWNKAIRCAEKLKQIGKIKRGENIAHFYCELAENALTAGQIENALAWIKKAETADRSCVRTSLVLADIQIFQGFYRDALDTLQRVENQNPEYISEVVVPMMKCYNFLGNISEQIDRLNRLHQRYPILEITRVLVGLIRERDGLDAAISFMSTQVKRDPTLSGLHGLIDLLLDQSQDSSKQLLQDLKGITNTLLKEKPAYCCTQCGFRGAELHWRCPSCHHWETIKIKSYQ